MERGFTQQRSKPISDKTAPAAYKNGPMCEQFSLVYKEEPLYSLPICTGGIFHGTAKPEKAENDLLNFLPKIEKFLPNYPVLDATWCCIYEGERDGFDENSKAVISVAIAAFTPSARTKLKMKFGAERLISDFPEVKGQYLSCLKRLISFNSTVGTHRLKGETLQELEDEIKHLQVEISPYRK